MKRLLLTVLALVLALAMALPLTLSASAAITTITLASSPYDGVTGTQCHGYTTTTPLPDPLDVGTYSFGSWVPAVDVTSTHSGSWWYDTSLITPAVWVSSSATFPREGDVDEDQWRLFKEDFAIPAGATNISGTLSFTADNAVAIYLNGVFVAATPDGPAGFEDLVYGPSPFGAFNSQYFENLYTANFVPQEGTNTLMFVVRNHAWPDENNITGLLYRAEIEYEEASIQEIPDIEIVKTVYAGHDDGAQCPGGSDVVVGEIGDEVTYCFTVINTGDTYLKDVTVTDTVLGQIWTLGVLPPSPNPGYRVSFYDERTIDRNLLNCAEVVGIPAEEDGTELGLPDAQDQDCAAVGTCPNGSECDAVFLVIDEDSIDNGLPPNFFSATDVNDHIADIGLRDVLPYFAAHVGDTITLHTGEVGDEGWFALKTIPGSWAAAGPTVDGLQNYILAGPGLGTPDPSGDREALLDKIPGVTPLRATGLKMLEGKQVCAVVYDSDISINYDPLNGSLKGDNLGKVAFEVISVTQLTGYSSSSLPKVDIEILDVGEVCGECTPRLFTEAPEPFSSSLPFDVVP